MLKTSPASYAKLRVMGQVIQDFVFIHVKGVSVANRPAETEPSPIDSIPSMSNLAPAAGWSEKPYIPPKWAAGKTNSGT